MFARLVVIAAVAALLLSALARTSEGAGPERRYAVRPADTLWSIATRHYAGDPREAVWELRERNRLAGTTIRPGQVLVLP